MFGNCKQQSFIVSFTTLFGGILIITAGLLLTACGDKDKEDSTSTSDPYCGGEVLMATIDPEVSVACCFILSLCAETPSSTGFAKTYLCGVPARAHASDLAITHLIEDNSKTCEVQAYQEKGFVHKIGCTEEPVNASSGDFFLCRAWGIEN